jgi:histone deacetylase 11
LFAIGAVLEENTAPGKRQKANFMFKIKLLLVFFISLSFGGSKRPCGDSLPIIYSNNYNISILGIENFHPFDSKKYEKVYHGLISEGHLCPRQFYKPSRPSDEILLLVHTPEYLRSLKKSSVVASIAEIPPLEYLPNFILQNSLLEPMRLATGGTILGVHLALRYGWAINPKFFS